ncbi:hypothetical protein TRVL_08928 [Trypanosoma vivax]|nr:hypothetical protein TRVL_08928 [Trypanosoma vivax]
MSRIGVWRTSAALESKGGEALEKRKEQGFWNYYNCCVCVCVVGEMACTDIHFPRLVVPIRFLVVYFQTGCSPAAKPASQQVAAMAVAAYTNGCLGEWPDSKVLASHPIFLWQQKRLGRDTGVNCGSEFRALDVNSENMQRSSAGSEEV